MKNVLTIRELAEACEAEAIASKLAPNALSDYRRICREYSRKFHTPLHVVVTLDPEWVILNCIEDDYMAIDIEEPEKLQTLLDRIYTIEDPDYASEQEEDLNDFVEDALEQERMRIAHGKPIHKNIKPEDLDGGLPKGAPAIKSEPKPTQGFLDLSYLQENESGDFED